MFNFDTYYEHIHVYDNKAKVSDGDCVVKGRTVYTCRCSDYYNEFAYGAHNYKDVITKATFKADGKTENKCTFCGDVKKTTVIPKITAKLSKSERKVFMMRYWLDAGIEQISSQTGFSHSKIKSMLKRLRDRLAQALKKEGIIV